MNPSLRTGASLGIVLVGIVVLAGVAKAVVRKNGAIGAALGAGASPAGILEVLGRYPIARGHSIILLKVERRILMLAHTHGKLRAGGGSISVLCQIDDPDDVASILLKAQEASGSSTAGRFQELLHAFGAGHDDGVDVVDTRSARLERGRDIHSSAVQSDSESDEPPRVGLRIADFEQQMVIRQQQERARSLARGGR